MEFGKAILINKDIVKKGSRSDIVTDYTFKNTFCIYDDLVDEVQRLERAKSVPKGTETWLECTHELLEANEQIVTIRFVFPYCG